MKLEDTCSLGRKAMTNLDDILKSRDITLLTKICLVKAIVFPVVTHIFESWTIKKVEHWYFWTVVLEKTLESPLDRKEIKPVNTNGNQSWILDILFRSWIRTDAEAPKLWPPDVKSQLIRKDPDAGKYRRQEEKGMTEDKMVGWCRWLNGYEFEQTAGDGEWQGSLGCGTPWDCLESDMTGQLNSSNILFAQWSGCLDQSRLWNISSNWETHVLTVFLPLWCQKTFNKGKY